MTISVQAVYDRGSNRLNEDELLVTGSLFAVFDGATSLIGYENARGETGGRIAATIAAHAFVQERSLQQSAVEANDRLQRCMTDAGIDMHRGEALWAVAVAAVRLTGAKLEFLTIGNCLILAILGDGSHMLLTPYVNQDLDVLTKWKELADHGVEDIYGALKPEIDEVRRQANRRYGYLNGQREAVEFLRAGQAELDDFESLVLFTDGLHIPSERPADPEGWGAFVELYRRAGLTGILQHVRTLERDDPECRQYARFKQHDDVAAIGINLRAAP
jgi:hypothetical protein